MRFQGRRIILSSFLLQYLRVFDVQGRGEAGDEPAEHVPEVGVDNLQQLQAHVLPTNQKVNKSVPLLSAWLHVS